MAGAGRGKEKASLHPLFCARRRKRGAFSGLIAISLNFPLAFLSPFLPSLPFCSLVQAPAPSNRTERHEVPVRGRPHPSQLGRVALHRGQSHHQRVQYDRACGHGHVHPVSYIQRLGVRRMIRAKQTQKNQTKREIFTTGKMDPREGKKTYKTNIADEKRTD